MCSSFNKPTTKLAHFEQTCHQWTVSAASSCGQCIRSADPCLTQLPADANQTLTLIRPDLDWAKTVRNRGSQVNVVDASSLKHDGASERFQSMLICFLCVLQTEADFSRKSQARAAHFWLISKQRVFILKLGTISIDRCRCFQIFYLYLQKRTATISSLYGDSNFSLFKKWNGPEHNVSSNSQEPRM